MNHHVIWIGWQQGCKHVSRIRLLSLLSTRLVGFPTILHVLKRQPITCHKSWRLSLGWSRKPTSDYALLTRNNLVDEVRLFSSSASVRALGTSLVIVLKTLVWRAMLVVFLLCFTITPTFTCKDGDNGMFRCLLCCIKWFQLTELYSHVVLFIMLYKVVLTFKSVDETLVCDHSNESYWAVLSCGTVYYAVQGGSNF